MLQNSPINTTSLEEIKKFIKKNNAKTKIIAVTKTLSQNAINSAIENKITIIGENRVLEAEKKIKNYKNREKIETHLIGHLQSNKTKKAVQLFDVIQTADTIKIIKLINKHAAKANKKQKIFLQINIGEDVKKFGFLTKEIKKTIKETIQLKNIKVEGVMTILPQQITPQKTKKYYEKLKKIQEKIQKEKIKSCRFTSMGMSGDYKEAVEAGATHIRIGTLLYGKRKK